MFRDLRQYMDALRQRSDLVEIDEEVDARLEIAEIHRRVIAAGGPALLFKRVKGSPFPVVTNLFGTRERIDLAWGDQPKEWIRMAAEVPAMMPPSWRHAGRFARLGWRFLRTGTRRVRRAPVMERRLDDLTRLPALTCWKDDGGAFVTWPLVHTRHPDPRVGAKADNLGIYRMQIFNARETGMHFQIAKGGGFHLHAAEAMGQDLPVTVHVGGPPLLTLAAACPLPENIPEILLASWLMGEKLRVASVPGHPIDAFADAEFCLAGVVPSGARRPEGPFGDHYGYYSLTHDFPVFRVTEARHRDGAVWPATVVGKPRQEDFFLGDYLQELLLPLARVAMPQIKDLWSYGEAGYHAVAAATLRERYAREAMSAAMRLLGEGQVGLSKVLIGVDRDMDLRDFRAVLSHTLERIDWSRDCLVVPNVALDTLDYAGPRLNHGSKVILLGLGEPRRQLPTALSGDVPTALVDRAVVFAPGVLVVQINEPADRRDPETIARLARLPAFKEWQMIVVVDDAARATRSVTSFMWHTFTRMDPQQDMFAAGERVAMNAVSREAPIVIDARMKPRYPAELFCDEATDRLVTDRWKKYFPNHDVAQGDSLSAHLFAEEPPR